MKRKAHPTAVVLLLLAGFATSAAIEAEPAQDYNLGPDKLALGGYDPVSYFGTARPTSGSKNITAKKDGVVYRFASAANRDRFLADPQKYLPAYGGWCATAMAEGKKVEVDPRNYRVTEGRLFLFYKSVVHDAQDDWKNDEARLRAKADANWKRITVDQRERA